MVVRTPALTLYQPWASLMVLGCKRIETRSWSTRHRGTLAIHSGREFPQEARHFARSRAVWDALYLAGIEPDDTLRAWPLGMVLGTVELIDVVPTLHADPILAPRENHDTWLVRARLERDLGDFTLGRYAWLTANRWRFRLPAVATGHQGIWQWEHDGKLLRPTVYS